MALAACRRDSADSSGAAADRDDLATVTVVIDGDTIDVDIQGGTERVRLLGIDTPEIEHEGEPGECYGAEAKRYMERLLPAGGTVRLERDVVGRDDYGRLLAYVFDVAGDRLVNEQLVAEGFATPLVIEPNVAYRRRFVDAARGAQAAGLGLWSSCTN